MRSGCDSGEALALRQVSKLGYALSQLSTADRTSGVTSDLFAKSALHTTCKALPTLQYACEVKLLCCDEVLCFQSLRSGRMPAGRHCSRTRLLQQDALSGTHEHLHCQSQHQGPGRNHQLQEFRLLRCEVQICQSPHPCWQDRYRSVLLQHPGALTMLAVSPHPEGCQEGTHNIALIQRPMYCPQITMSTALSLKSGTLPSCLAVVLEARAWAPCLWALLLKLVLSFGSKAPLRMATLPSLQIRASLPPMLPMVVSTSSWQSTEISRPRRMPMSPHWSHSDLDVPEYKIVIHVIET